MSGEQETIRQAEPVKSTADEQDLAVEKKQALAEHFRALRRVLIISAAAVLVVFAVPFYGFCDTLATFILIPVKARGIDVISTAVSDALVMKFKVCLVAALVCAMPVIIWQVWSFVAPALYAREKKAFALMFFAMLLLFVTGVLFCYIVIFPLTIDLFWEAGNNLAESMWNVKDYFNFVLSFVLPFGLMFDLPIVMYLLARKGMISYKSAAKSRKFVLLGIAVVAAILTPPDVVSQIMLMLPMILLFELSLQIIRFVQQKKTAEEAA